MSRLMFLLPVLFMACNTQPRADGGMLSADDEPAERRAAEGDIAGQTVTVTESLDHVGGEAYERVFNDVKGFIDNLNVIIKSRNYDKWKAALSEERFKEISSPEFLASASKMVSMRRRGIVLKTANDYFNFVVVPSRADIKVDKIDIMGDNRVRAIMYRKKTEDGNNEEHTEPLLVYELARTGDTWMIIQ